jgi:hypothetical protein
MTWRAWAVSTRPYSQTFHSKLGKSRDDSAMWRSCSENGNTALVNKKTKSLAAGPYFYSFLYYGQMQ